ncbi:hypothetical protein AB1Y20_018160 [Prymnesium parvum]|uniref:Cdc37 N-terminal domain-containing protein n=1 Tax=Prymnesium parvum TaxID=97485 RepID=A0AB34JR27_PRYPA
MAAEWLPLADDGTPAALGSHGRWLCTAEDVVATDADARVALWSSPRLPLCFPRRWPEVFDDSPPLKALLHKSMLHGERCRAVLPPPADALAAAAAVPLHPLHSFANASRLAAACGWPIVKGFLVLEREEAPAGSSFVALRHWWNAREEGGAWLDLTPPLRPSADPRRLLVKSARGEKPPAPLTQGSYNFAVGLASRLAAGAEPPAAPAAAPAAPAEGKAGGSSAGGAAAVAAKKKIDYSKWDAVEVSDDEEQAPPKVDPKEKEALEKAQREAAEKAMAREQREHVKAAIDAAAAAAAAGDAEALAGMQAAYREAAPLDPEMERIIAALPEAAQIAARASATLAAEQAKAGQPTGTTSNEPTLKELLAAQKIDLDADDPALEDPREFFETAEAAAVAEGKLAHEQRASAERVAAHVLLSQQKAAQRPKQVNDGDVEWVGEWS